MSSLTIQGLKKEQITTAIDLLTQNLINIKDTTGQFLLKLADGRIIDTKGWDGWEWTHGIGLYGLWHYYTLTGNQATKDIMLGLYTTQFAKGTTKNINTMSPFLSTAVRYRASANAVSILLGRPGKWAAYSPK